jgi:hypothetical protein
MDAGIDQGECVGFLMLFLVWAFSFHPTIADLGWSAATGSSWYFELLS